MKINVVMGIDPGINGAVAYIGYPGKEFISFSALPVIKIGSKKELDEAGLWQLFEIDVFQIKHVFIEKAQSMPGQGVVSTFSYGVSYGILLGMISACSFPQTRVPPARWKKNMISGASKDKNISVLRAKQLYPDITLKKNDHHAADAILIARYGIEHLSV